MVGQSNHLATEIDLIARHGSEAWQRLRRVRNWDDWLIVGTALQALREEAMNLARIPPDGHAGGGAYNAAMRRLLMKYGSMMLAAALQRIDELERENAELRARLECVRAGGTSHIG